MQQSGANETELMLALERLVPVIRKLATAGGLGLPAAAVLARLTSEGPQRLTNLAATEGVSQPSMTQLVSRLERAGLVRRGPFPDDGRVVLVEATAAGRDLLDCRRTERTTALRRLLGQLDPAEREAIQRAVPALVRLAELARPVSARPQPARMSS